MKVTAIKGLPKYRLQLTFADGVKGEVDLSAKVGKGVFSAWKDPEVFARVRVGELGELVWPGDVDLCADALYQGVTGHLPAEFKSEPANA